MDLATIQFAGAVMLAARTGDTRALVLALRSKSLEITRADRELLAQYLADELPRRNGAPRKTIFERWLAMFQHEEQIISTLMDDLRPPHSKRPLKPDYDVACAEFETKMGRRPRCDLADVKEFRRRAADRKP